MISGNLWIALFHTDFKQSCFFVLNALISIILQCMILEGNNLKANLSKHSNIIDPSATVSYLGQLCYLFAHLKVQVCSVLHVQTGLMCHHTRRWGYKLGSTGRSPSTVIMLLLLPAHPGRHLQGFKSLSPPPKKQRIGNCWHSRDNKTTMGDELRKSNVLMCSLRDVTVQWLRQALLAPPPHAVCEDNTDSVSREIQWKSRKWLRGCTRMGCVFVH